VSPRNLRPGDAVPSPLALRFEGDSGEQPLRAIVSGEIDVATAPSMQAEISQARSRTGTSRIVLDLAGVQFMDSSGLRVILLLHQQLEAEQGGLVLIGASEELENLLTLTGLDRHLSIAESFEQACAMLADGRPSREQD
jgi:anti-sigma B factor antagonist